MRPFTELRGNRFPDTALVRHFYKRGLDAKPGRVLELGCGNGVNLTLYAAYGWSTFGVDADPKALQDAAFNLEGEDFQGLRADLRDGGEPFWSIAGPKYDALLLPYIIVYLNPEEAVQLMRDLRPCLAPGCEVFVRTRAEEDDRLLHYDEGIRLTHTGEEGMFHHFYDPLSLAELLKVAGIETFKCLYERFDNPQGPNDTITHNVDVIAWGVTPS